MLVGYVAVEDDLPPHPLDLPAAGDVSALSGAGHRLRVRLSLALRFVARGPIPALYGTTLLLMLALIADQMPFASRAGISAMMQLGREPEEAAQVAGAGWWRRLAAIVLPIQKRALFTGMLLPFIRASRT